MSEKPLDLDIKLNSVFHNIEDELLWRLEKKKLNKTEIRSILKGSKEYLLKEIKQRIKEACMFYLRYKDHPKLLIKEHPKYKKEFTKTFLEMMNYSPERLMDNKYKWISMLMEYNEWLFKLAFKDVFEKVKGK